MLIYIIYIYINFLYACYPIIALICKNLKGIMIQRVVKSTFTWGSLLDSTTARAPPGRSAF